MVALDSVVFNTVFSLIGGKGYSIFALLFGFTFYVQYTNQKNKGRDFRLRFIWRLNVGGLYEIVQEGVKSGNLATFFSENITTGQKASLLWAINGGRFVQTIGLFLLGFLLSRKNLFVNSQENIRFWIKLLIVSSLLFGLLYPLKVEWYDNASSEIVKNSIGTALDMWQKLFFTFVLVASFVITYYNSRFRKWMDKLSVYGKMSLTNYISQSIIGAFVFFPIGLNLAPHLGYTASLIVGILIFIIQLCFCKLWYKRYKQGPLEKLWHKATWI